MSDREIKIYSYTREEYEALQAALTAAAERETKLREENARLVEDCNIASRSAMTAFKERDAALDEAERLNGALLALKSQLEAERQKVRVLRTKLERKSNARERVDEPRRDFFIGARGMCADVLMWMDQIGLTPDPPREK